MLYFNKIDTPVGQLTLYAEDDCLLAVAWQDEKLAKYFQQPRQYLPQHDILQAAQQQLDEYFHRQRRQFDLPLRMIGTDFQQAVWRQLQSIPYGETRSYLQIAQAVGNAKAVRAVGLANGRNPLSIVVPCHRVIGANGKLVGFGGGLDNKAKLLWLEKGVFYKSI